MLAFIAGFLTMPASASAAPASTTIVAKHSGKCLDVRGGPTQTANGALIEQWSCSGEANQDWTLKDTGGGRYQIIARSSGKCVQTINNGTANRTGLEQSDCTGASQQLWQRKSTGTTGEYTFVHVPSGRCLDITGGPTATGDGALAELWDCTGEANQTWTIGAPAAPPGNGTGPYGQDPNLYTSTFSDEFDGSSLNTGKWGTHLWYQPADPTPNYVVSNGSLKMFPVAGTEYKRDYRHITTDGLYYQTYGFFEIEAKLPHGRGPWPAFWLYNHDTSGEYRPEIDIMEAYPGGGPDSGWSDANLHPTTFACTIWRGDPGDMAGTRKLQTPDLSAGFHKYAVKWEPNKMTFYFDGQAYYTLDVSMSQRMYILLSFQFGSASGPGDATTPTGQGNSFEINYMRAWKFKNA